MTNSKIMSIINISSVHNLPRGGAKSVYDDYLINLRKNKKYKITEYVEPSPSKGLINYLIYSYIYLPLCWYPRIIDKINSSDVILANHSWITKSPLFFKLKKIPLIYICHEGMREYYDRDIISKLSIKDKLFSIIKYPLSILDRLNIRHANVVISNSKYSKKRIDKYYGINSKIIYPGIIYKNTKISKHKKKYFVTISSIFPHKRLQFYIDVVAEFNNKYSDNYELIIVSSEINNKYLTEILEYSKNNNVKIKICRNISNANKNRLINEGKIFLYAPTNEPFGLSIYEALQGNIQVVCYKYGGGYSELIKNQKGKLQIIDSLDINEWVLSCKQMIGSRPSQYKQKIKYSNQYYSELTAIIEHYARHQS